MGAVPEALADLCLAYTQDHPHHLHGRAGQHSDAPEECHDSGYRGTVCVHCARTGLWGGWVGNRWLYPEADRAKGSQCFKRIPRGAAAQRGRSASEIRPYSLLNIVYNRHIH